MSESDAYDALAPAYDLMTAGHAHDAWLEAIEHLARAHGLRGERVLDVACGTGKSFLPLLRRGYAVTACDGSPQMAALAQAKAGARARVTVADMRRLPVFGAFDLVTCLDDAVNHLATPDEVLGTLAGMRANLAPGGLIVFDVNLLRAYAEADDAIVDGEAQLVLYRGRAARHARAGAGTEVVLDLFTSCGGGLYVRSQVRQAHRHFPVAELRRLAAAAGLRVLDVRGQQPGGVLAPTLDEARDRKALFVLTHDE